MLMVEVNGVGATWDEEATKWHSSDKKVEAVLDSLLPPEAFHVHANIYLEGGTQRLALESAQAFFEGSLTVVADTPPAEVGDPPPGVEY